MTHVPSPPSALTIDQHLTFSITIQYLHLHTGAVMRDLTMEQYLTQKDPCSSNCLRTPHAAPLEPTQNATTNYDHHCTVGDCSFTKC